MKGWLSCLPVSVMAAGPGLRAGMSTCQTSSFMLSLRGWLSMLAVSKVGAVAALISAGLPGLP